MSVSVRNLCRDWLVDRPLWERVARRGRGVTAAVVTRRLLCPLVSTSIPGMPSMHARISSSQAWAAHAVLERGKRDIEADLMLVREGVDDGVRIARDLGIEVSARDLADKLSRAIRRAGGGRHLGERGLETEVVAYLRQRPPAGRSMTRREFSGYAERYEASWAVLGERNLGRFPYSTYSLGPDEMPPLVASERESTWLGLGRSVYSRFRLAAQDRLVHGDAHEIAAAEVARACGPLGLVSRSALVVLRSISVGLLYGPGGVDWIPPRDVGFDESWRYSEEPVEPCPPRSDDPFLPRGEWVNADLAAFAQACVAAFLTGTRQGAMLRRAGLVERAHAHVMRRAWMMCFESERRGLPIDGRRAARIVSYAVFKGIPGGEAYRHRQFLLGGAADGEFVGLGLGQERVTRALEWLAGRRDLALRLVSDADAEAAAEYAEAAERLDLPELGSLLAHFGRGDA